MFSVCAVAGTRKARVGRNRYCAETTFFGFQNAKPAKAQLIRDDDQECLYKAEMRTTDDKLDLTFLFRFLKAYPSVLVTTEVENRSKKDEIFDIEYARVVDPDVQNAPPSNSFTSSDNAVYACNENRSRIFNNFGLRFVTVGVAGYGLEGSGGDFFKDDFFSKNRKSSQVLYADEFIYDDRDLRGVGPEAIKNRFPFTFDGNAGIHYRLDNLKRHEKASVSTLYFAGEGSVCGLSL